jgi:hypothetical protein
MGRDRHLSFWHRPAVREPLALPPLGVGHSVAVSGRTSKGVAAKQHRNPMLLLRLCG